MVRSIPLSRSVQLHPFIHFLDRIGAPTDRGLERHKLPRDLSHDPTMLISTRAMSAFIGKMALREGIKDFGWQAASLNQIPLLVRMIQSSTTLLHALKTICRLGYHESSNIQIWLEEREETLFFCYRGSLEPGALGADELAMMRTRVVTRIVQKFAGPDWTPPECGFELAGEISQLVREDFGNARLRCVPNYGWVQLPKSILALPPRTPVPLKTKSGTEYGDEQPLDLVGSLVQLLGPYFEEGTPSLHDVAGMAGTSVRSLQRELARAGSSYRDVLKSIKFDKARELLKQPDLKITDIAHLLGFSDQAHFSRFFRRYAGLPPQKYRTARNK